jgi:hypothetical protein
MNNISVEGGPEAQISKQEEIYHIYKQLEDRLGIAWSGATIASNAISAGNLEKARPFMDEGLRIIDEINFPEMSAWVLWAPMRYFIVKEDYERVEEIRARRENLPVNALRPQMQMMTHVLRIYVDSLVGDLNLAKVRARLLEPYVEMVGVGQVWILFAFSTILELEGRHELALEFITTPSKKIALYLRCLRQHECWNASKRSFQKSRTWQRKTEEKRSTLRMGFGS